MKKKRIFLILLDGRKSELIIKKWGKLNKLFKYSHLKIKINSIKIIIKYKKPFFYLRATDRQPLPFVPWPRETGTSSPLIWGFLAATRSDGLNKKCFLFFLSV